MSESTRYFIAVFAAGVLPALGVGTQVTAQTPSESNRTAAPLQLPTAQEERPTASHHNRLAAHE